MLSRRRLTRSSSETSIVENPGPWELLLYILQVQPFKVAYSSFMQGEETRELVREKVLANLAESVPSAVLQAYALAVQGAPRKGHVTIVLISLAISVCSMSDGAKISVTLVRGIGMPPTRATDIFARTTRQRSVWHLHLSYWPGAVPTLAPESVGGLSLAWPVDAA